MGKVARAGVLAWLVFTGATLSAPAPTPRKPARGEESRTHPKRILGDWVLTWHGSPYHYRFLPDGTFVHSPINWQCDYSGTWKYDNGSLIISEYVEGRHILTYTLHESGGKWVTDHAWDWADTSLARAGFIS
jgi:hypothetical protein